MEKSQRAHTHTKKNPGKTGIGRVLILRAIFREDRPYSEEDNLQILPNWGAEGCEEDSFNERLRDKTKKLPGDIQGSSTLFQFHLSLPWLEASISTAGNPAAATTTTTPPPPPLQEEAFKLEGKNWGMFPRAQSFLKN